MGAMRRAWLWAAPIAARLLFAPAECWARVPTRLVYARTPAASDCPDEPSLAAAVAARLGYDPFSPWGDQTILATVTRSGDALVAHAELIDHDGITQGSREVRNSECKELILALALAISITLDPLRTEPSVEDPPSEAPPVPSSDPPSPPLPAPAIAPPPASTRAEPRSIRSAQRAKQPTTWYVTAAAIGALEAAPHFAFGGRLALTARRGRWALGLEGWSILPSVQSAPNGGEVRVKLVSATVAPCLRLVGQLSVCALGSLGSLGAEGRGIDAPRSEHVLHAGAGGRGSFVVPLGPSLELVANADLLATVNRPHFQLDGAEVWRPGPLVALLGIGASARFF